MKAPLMQPGSHYHTKRVTIREIAAKAGVAVCTVSSALHGTGRISEVERERIRALASELGYQPQVAAQLLRSRTTGHVGLVLSGEANAISVLGTGHAGPILGQFLNLCEKRDVPYYVEFFRPKEAAAFSPPAKMAGGLVDGVIVGGYVSKELRAWLQQEHWRWVSLCEPSDFCVLSADDVSTYEAVQQLATLGHRRIAYAGGSRKYLTHRLALAGFNRAMRDLKLPPVGDDWVSISGCTSEVATCREVASGQSWAARILAAKPRPTAIIALGTSFVRGIIHQAAQMGLKVPHDLSVIAVGLGVDAERAIPALSTMELDFGSLVDQALQMLLRRLEGHNEKPRAIRIPPRLVMRETVAACHNQSELTQK